LNAPVGTAEREMLRETDPVATADALAVRDAVELSDVVG
jgi:hypothetical protein